MIEDRLSAPDEEGPLDEVLAAYLRAEEAGEPVDREVLLANHPHLAEELQQFFADRERLARFRQADRQNGLRHDQNTGRQAEPPVPPRTRIRYFGGYELLEEIARGGAGVVYKARQTTLNRVVALKLILAGRLASEEDVRRFQTEAQAAAKLQHPHIVAIHEVGQHDHRHYLSMDYVAGSNLAEIVARGPLSTEVAAQYVRQAAEAIDYAHRQGVLHRDLKPSNLLVDPDDRVRVADFGLAGWVEGGSSLTRTGQALGTPGYMPPEQAAGRKELIGPTSDVYALGAVLYELLTGRPPFLAETPAATLQQVLEGEPERPRRHDPRVPRDLETICLKCLLKEPPRRYETAGLLAEDLGRFLEGRPILARPVSLRGRAWRWCRRNPAVAGLGMMATLLAAVLGVAAALAWPRSVPPDPPELLSEHPSLLEGATAAVPTAPPAAERPVYELREVRGLQAHRGGGVAVALSRDGKLLATGSESDVPGVVRLWEVESGRLVGELYGHSLGIMTLAFSPDGKLLASGSRDETVRVWDLKAHQARFTTMKCGGWTQSIAFSADGDRLLVGVPSESQPLRVFDVPTGRLVAAHPAPAAVCGIAVPPQGDSAAVGFHEVGHEQSLELLTLAPEIQGTLVSSYPGGTEALAYSPDRRWLATGGSEGELVLREVATGRRVPLGKHPHRVSGLAFSPDGALLAALSERGGTPPGAIHLWDMRTHERLAVGAQENAGTDLTFTPTGDALISGNRDGRVRVWRLLKNGEPYGGHVTPVALGESIAPSQFGDDWRWGRGLSLERMIPLPDGEAVDCVAVTPDGKYTLSAGWDDVLRVTELSTGREVHSFDLPAGPHPAPVAVSPEGRFAAARAADGESVTLYDLETGKPVRSLERPPFLPVRMAFSPDSRTLLACGTGESAQAAAWDVGSGRRLYSASVAGDEYRHVSLSPDGRYFTIPSDADELTVWEVQTGRVVHRLPHVGVFAAGFSPDGRRLLTCPRGGGTLRVWDVETGRELRRFPWPFVQTDGAVWLPGSETALVRFDGNWLRLVDLKSGEALCRIESESYAARHLALAPDGRHVVSAGGYRWEDGKPVPTEDTALRVWRVEAQAPSEATDHALPALTTTPEGETIWTGWRWPTADELRHLPGSERLRFDSSGNEYRRIDVYGLSWHEAKALCELLGGHLATITSAEENEFVHENFTQDHAAWLGASDWRKEGHWQWVTGEPFAFTNWAAKEPYGGNGYWGEEDYLTTGTRPSTFHAHGPYWNDFRVSGTHQDRPLLTVLCEWEAPRRDGPAAEAEKPSAGDGDDPALDEMWRRFLAMAALGQRDGVELRRIEQPLHRFADEAREVHDGSVWAWGRTGRPLVLAALEDYGDRMSYELLSLSTEPVSVAVVTGDGWRWAPPRPGLRFDQLDDGPAPATAPEERIPQMVQIASRYDIAQTDDSGRRQELSLLPESLYRFSNPDEGLVDGAIFAYVNGTNPEVLLVLECRRGDGLAFAWYYALAPLTTAAAEAHWDGAIVWSKPHAPQDPKTQDPYSLFRLQPGEPVGFRGD